MDAGTQNLEYVSTDDREPNALGIWAFFFHRSLMSITCSGLVCSRLLVLLKVSLLMGNCDEVPKKTPSSAIEIN